MSDEARRACGPRPAAIVRLATGIEPPLPGAGLRIECRDAPCDTDDDCAGLPREPWRDPYRCVARRCVCRRESGCEE